MSSLNVLVFKDGKPQPSALVRLDGPSGPKLMNTNGVGAANFMDLAPGKYYVGATLCGQSLGVGYMNLPPGGGGTILFKKPPKRNEQKQGNQAKSNSFPFHDIFQPGWSYGYGVGGPSWSYGYGEGGPPPIYGAGVGGPEPIFGVGRDH